MSELKKIKVSGGGAKGLEVDAELSLAELHRILSPGSDELHEFVVSGKLKYGEPDADDQLVGRKVQDDSGVPVSTLAGKTVEYRCGRSSAVLKVGRIL